MQEILNDMVELVVLRTTIEVDDPKSTHEEQLVVGAAVHPIENPASDNDIKFQCIEAVKSIVKVIEEVNNALTTDYEDLNPNHIEQEEILTTKPPQIIEVIKEDSNVLAADHVDFDENPIMEIEESQSTKTPLLNDLIEGGTHVKATDHVDLSANHMEMEESQSNKTPAPIIVSSTSGDLNTILNITSEGDPNFLSERINKRKRQLEEEADYRAKAKLNELEKESKTLEDVIDYALKDYIEAYEMAQLVRVKFELEKTKLINKVSVLMTRRDIAVNNSDFQFYIDENDENIPPSNIIPHGSQDDVPQQQSSVKRRKFIPPIR
jgi:hypothetical protein